MTPYRSCSDCALTVGRRRSFPSRLRYDGPVQHPDPPPRKPRKPRAPTARPQGPHVLRVNPVAEVIGEFVAFWSQVEADSEAGCWPWRGAVGPKGYGLFHRADGRVQPAHLYAFEVSIGPLPPHKHVKQRCGFKLCMNAWHMRLGWPARSARAPISREAVAFGRALRHMRRARGLSQAALARMAGMAAAQVCWLEAGKLRLTERTCDRLAAGLEMDPEELARLLGG